MSKNKVTLVAGRDLWVNESKPNANYRGSTKLVVRGGSNSRRFAYLYFPVNIPRKATIKKATLRLVMRDSTSGAGSRTVTVQRISENWKQSKVTWNNRPSVAGSSVSVTKTGRQANEVWEFDVSSHMQIVANGTAFHGWRIEIDENVARAFHSSEAHGRKPRLEIEWNEEPFPPNDLNPAGGGFVASPSPVLTWDFRDNRGSTTMGGFRVQLSTDPAFSTVLHDSGEKVSSLPLYDLSTATGWTPLASGAPVYWRVKVKDDANNWSSWSDVVSFAYDAKGTLSIGSPTDNGVFNDLSPTVVWSLAGKNQSMWQVIVRESDTGVEVYDSGKHASLQQSWEIPAKVRNKPVIAQKNKNYDFVVRVWDDVDRANVVGGDVMYEKTVTARYAPATSPTLPRPTQRGTYDRTGAGEPGILVRWDFYDSTAPDRFDILRSEDYAGDNAIKIDSVDPGDVYNPANTSIEKYIYTDYSAKTGVTYSYFIVASRDGLSAESLPAVGTAKNKVPGIWLIDRERNIQVQIIGDDSGSWEMPEVSAVYNPIGASASRLVTQALRGYEGSISGLLSDRKNRTFAQQEADLFELKAIPGRTYWLVLPDFAIPVVINNVVVAPTPHKETVRNVSFNFYQQGDLPFRQTL